MDKDLKRLLLSVKMPGRYTGGEFGSINGVLSSDFKIVLSFPDLYEIGMSNLAVRLLYREINSIQGIGCERVFAPAPDFENRLRETELPLFSLESSKPLFSFDIIAFSIGTELCGTNLLNILDLGNIPINREDRDNSCPIVIAGGPAITNPLPFADFLDAVFIGEAEDEFIDLLKDLSSMKKGGAQRVDILSKIASNKSVWTPSKVEDTKRAIWMGFGGMAKAHLPVPNIRTVQDHGIIEIMRGCPNGCRFCHAGNFYKPYREKPASVVIDETVDLVKSCGYREITLSSLSSSDYHGITGLIANLNGRFSEKGVSFSLPSMRINSFTLPLLAEISKTRKSGLTFAVETPELSWQKSINKEVPLERTINILNEAKKAGWKSAKFYFMIGLPESIDKNESEAIINFLNNVRQGSGMNITVSIGTFIPKAHTPYQRAAQLSEEESLNRFLQIKKGLNRKYFKTSYHSPFSSYLEGIISRGDERVGGLILKAFNAGARLDSWDEYLQKDIWRGVISDADWNVEDVTCRERSNIEKLPWDKIDFGITGKYNLSENLKSANKEQTEPCETDCNHYCGVCAKEISVKKNVDDFTPVLKHETEENHVRVKCLFSFEKKGKAIFLSHINIMTIFERSLLRAGFLLKHTEGFNPKPKLEFAHPLSLGISSDEEIGSIELFNYSGKKNFLYDMNKVLPSGINITNALEVEIRTQNKRPSLMSQYRGSEYFISIYDEADNNLIHIIESAITSINKNGGSGINPEDISYKRLETGITIRLINRGTKYSNILNFLKIAIDKENIMNHINLHRLKTYSKGEGEGVYSYFDIYPFL